jgi:hypothetical protein
MRSLSVLIVAALAGCGPNWTYKECVQRLAAGTPHEQIRDAIRILDGAGTKAFPSLIAHFADTKGPSKNISYRIHGLMV